jgi:hypothetical protein
MDVLMLIIFMIFATILNFAHKFETANDLLLAEWGLFVGVVIGKAVFYVFEKLNKNNGKEIEHE